MEIGPGPESPNPIQYFGDLTCSGTARFVNSSGSVHTFAELLTVGNDTNGGRCATTGRIEARLNSDGSLDWRWFDPDDKSPRVTALLQRQPACPQPPTTPSQEK
jgi:hypothetical protein